MSKGQVDYFKHRLFEKKDVSDYPSPVKEWVKDESPWLKGLVDYLVRFPGVTRLSAVGLYARMATSARVSDAHVRWAKNLTTRERADAVDFLRLRLDEGSAVIRYNIRSGRHIRLDEKALWLLEWRDDLACIAWVVKQTHLPSGISKKIHAMDRSMIAAFRALSSELQGSTDRLREVARNQPYDWWGRA